MIRRCRFVESSRDHLADGGLTVYQCADDVFRTALIRANNRVIGGQQQVEAGSRTVDGRMRYRYPPPTATRSAGGTSRRCHGT
jgi:hypothetical protein